MRVEFGFHLGALLRTKGDTFPMKGKTKVVLPGGHLAQPPEEGLQQRRISSSVSGSLLTRRGIIIWLISRVTGAGEFKLMICFVEC